MNIIDVILNQIYEYDIDTALHCLNVKEYSYLIGKQLNLSQKELSLLQAAAVIHDIGKIFIPSEIINKSSKLSQEEFCIIKEHSFIGYQYLSQIGINNEINRTIIEHHEKVDGSGYPKKLMDNEISIFSKIICVADVYDALTSKRPYKEAVSPEEAIKILKNNEFSQLVVSALIESLSN